MKKIFPLIIATFFCFNSFSQTDKDLLIVSSFYQGSANNCASVALIKAAMLKYGYKNMFEFSKNGDNYNIKLKDGTQFVISENERLLAKNKYANFNIKDIPSLGIEKDTVLFYAYLAYASIAKFIVKNGYWGCIEEGSPHYTNIKTYNDALWFISRKSFCTDYCYRLLGYKSKENKVYDFKSIVDVNQTGTILYSWGHAVVVYKNNIDCHGTWIPVTIDEMCNNKFGWYIILE